MRTNNGSRLSADSFALLSNETFSLIFTQKGTLNMAIILVRLSNQTAQVLTNLAYRVLSKGEYKWPIDETVPSGGFYAIPLEVSDYKQDDASIYCTVDGTNCVFYLDTDNGQPVAFPVCTPPNPRTPDSYYCQAQRGPQGFSFTCSVLSYSTSSSSSSN